MWQQNEKCLDILMYMKRVIYDDGFYLRARQGISLVCPLSPLMGAVYLRHMDESMEKNGVFYVRYGRPADHVENALEVEKGDQNSERSAERVKTSA